MIKKKQQQPCHCFILQCSVSCGRGHKQRSVYCMARDGSLLESEHCKHLAKPSGHRECRGGRCPKWKAGAWSQVSNASPLRLLRALGPACWLVRLCPVLLSQRGALDWEGRLRQDTYPYGTWAGGFKPCTRINPCGRVVVRMNPKW